MIYEANASSSACRLWRVPQVETGTPPKVSAANMAVRRPPVKQRESTVVS